MYVEPYKTDERGVPLDTTHFIVEIDAAGPYPTYLRQDHEGWAWATRGKRVAKAGWWHRLDAVPSSAIPIAEYDIHLRRHQQKHWADTMDGKPTCWHEPTDTLNGLKCRHCSAWFCF